jgi:Tfp pilus assembly protein PilO
MNRRAVVFGALAVVAVVALWWVFVFSPMGDTLDDERDELEQAERQGQTLTAELNQLQDLEERSPEIEAQLGRLSAAIPESPNQADFISGLNAIADESGITWQSVTMQEPTEATAAAPPTTPVQIQIEGGYFQVLDYLNRLEDFERLVVVDAVNLSGAEAEDGATDGDVDEFQDDLTTTGDLSVSLTARIFSQTTFDAAPPATGDATNAPSGGNGDEVTN